MRSWRIGGFGNPPAAPSPAAVPDRLGSVPDQRAVSSGVAGEGQASGDGPGERPGPASPFADAVRRVPPCPLRVRSALSCADLDRVLSHVREIAVWAGNDGRVQDTGRFLLMDDEKVWHSVAFGGAQGTELIKRLRALPGFETNVLLDAVSARSGQIEPLWPPRVVASGRR